MPVPIIIEAIENGFEKMPAVYTFLQYVWKVLPYILAITLAKWYFGGARNTSERNMHSKVVMMTASYLQKSGGTAGIGAVVAHELASRGAQLVLLVQQRLNDAFLVDYIEDLRERTGNELITAEQVDLSSLHSIRVFATKWVDNAPPRRLDTIILCGNVMTPKNAPIEVSEDGVEATFAINYLANFHLLSILSPALRAQPPDRDVRVILGSCASYMGGIVPEQVPLPKRDHAIPPSSPKQPKDAKAKPTQQQTPRQLAKNPSLAYGSSKLALMTFAQAFQKHLSAYKRPDSNPVNAHVILADPGWSRTPGMRRYLTFGSLWGLAAYLIAWPFWCLVLKSPQQGAQTFLYAAMEEKYGKGEGGKLLKECREVKISDRKTEVRDEGVQKRLWEVSDKAIEALEKEGARRRAEAKKDEEEATRNEEKAKSAGPKPGSRKSRKAEQKEEKGQ
ncbi:MAG: hypothetical protein M1831_001698 [Alyxoria varia]|nr:MAG: hypothetical protein M1831_001698 [Alyxoria varia]